jgi:hypothetical protein
MDYKEWLSWGIYGNALAVWGRMGYVVSWGMSPLKWSTLSIIDPEIVHLTAARTFMAVTTLRSSIAATVARCFSSATSERTFSVATSRRQIEAI